MLIKEKGVEFSAELAHHKFQASNSWTDKFKKRHSIIQKVISEKSASVCMSDHEFWQLCVNANVR